MSAAYAVPSTIDVKDLLEANAVVGDAKRGVRRFWTGVEEKILKQNYPTLGLAGCLPLLPGRTASAIYGRAGALGLTGPQRAPRDFRRQRWTASEAIDAVIRRQYPQCIRKLDIVRLAASLGRPRWWVSKRAAKLGLVTPRFKEPNWSEQELELVLATPWQSTKTLQRKLKRAGFIRTETAIKIRLKRAEAVREDPDNYSAHRLAPLFGVDPKTVTGWCLRGLIQAKRRGTDRVAAQGGDSWWIHRREVRQFIIDNPAAFDIRKVDKLWFVDLLANGPGG